MKLLNIFRAKKHTIPCICDLKNKPEDCLVHTLNHEYGHKDKCKHCNYDEVKYQYEVKLK